MPEMLSPTTVVAIGAVFVLGVGTMQAADPPAGAFNLRVLSDSTPDWSSRENFVYSAIAHWPTEQERAIAQWRWFHRSRRVGSCVLEDTVA
jgi:hypothetical protein